MSEMLKYFRQDKMPHIWCPGCGHGIILNSLVRAVDALDLNRDQVVFISGIGCSSRATGYLDFDTLHTTHGRALAFATGIKLANPELEVIVITGDGDSAAIGGNHLIHAARRNINITTIVFNNSIYGMTSGQSSPLTPQFNYATTAPYGNVERNFDLCELVIAAGATYVARGTAYHTKLLIDLIKKGIQNKGFSMIEAVSQCPTYYGRKNKQGTAVEMLRWQKEHAVPLQLVRQKGQEHFTDKFVIGELYSQPAPEFTEEYGKIITKMQGVKQNHE